MIVQYRTRLIALPECNRYRIDGNGEIRQELHPDFPEEVSKQVCGANGYPPYVLHTGDLKEADGIIYLPLYMTPLL